ncbi:putative 2-hydroxyacid dehydrogenase [Hibiscus syriacus]|uniref:2-hydroxyacid dehydrogenase n=1 Tax=Hibiscus syriacus TaxID=106335 RepID=A0A6A3B9E0_HIBSY|nr:putative 2-hydroxyacid dehydrogenase [Hibiscus syriacus]
MLEETLKWRSTYKPEEIRWDEVAVEGETGKVYRANFHNRDGRTVLILRPGKQVNRNVAEHYIFGQSAPPLENAILNLPEGQQQMVWLIDFTGWSLSTSVPIKSSRVLQNHYPERLELDLQLGGQVWVISSFVIHVWRSNSGHFGVQSGQVESSQFSRSDLVNRIGFLCSDAKTFEKVKFVYPKNKDSVELMSSYFDEENLPTEFGGKAIPEYNHEEFSKKMVQDDTKSATLWGFDDKRQSIGVEQSGPEVAPEPISIAPAAS